jgi:uncharacterized protein YqgV (UPF0045/DUF77 family)
MNIRILTSFAFIFALTQAVHTIEEDQRKAMQEASAKKFDDQKLPNKKREQTQEPENQQEDKKQKIEQLENQNNHQQAIQRAGRQQDRQPQPDDIVTLRGYDSELDIKVTRKLACLSKTISDLIEDTGIDDPIPLPTITTQQLENFIIPACESIDSTQNYDEIKHELIKFFTIKEINLDDLLELIKSANYLDIKPLFEAACNYLIETVEKKKTLQEVQALQTVLTNHKIPKVIQAKNGTTYLKNNGCYCVQKTLEGHNKPIFAVTLSPDGNHLISGSFDKTIKIWSVPTLKQKSEHTPLIIQAWLIAHIMKCTSKEPYIIIQNSEEEKVWNELTEETRQQLQKLVKIKSTEEN